MFLKYLRDRLKVIVIFFIIFAIYLTVFYLYSVPVQIVVYGAVLSLFFIAIAAVFDLRRYCDTHKKLKIIEKTASEYIESLPESSSLIELDYQAIVAVLYKKSRDLISEYDNLKTETEDFYTLWVHQIKTPISALSLLLQSTSSDDKSKMQQELFKIERYAELVLEYLRMESISSDLKIKNCNLKSIVNNAIKKYAVVFMYKKISVETFDLDKEIITDEKWLTFVVEQLISNSLKYTNKGKIKIYFEDNVLIVQDTGIGISAEDLPRVFEKGFTGFNGRMHRKSTGLGLYLCKKITKKLGCKIVIESEPEKGTKVKLYTVSQALSDY